MNAFVQRFSRPPIVGLLAFILVFFTQGLGHTLWMLVSMIFGSEYQYLGAFLLGLLGVVILFSGMKNGNKVAATWLGYFAALLMWTGWIEYSFHFYAELTEIEERFFMQSTTGVMMVSLLYFFFNRETKCNFFQWFHRNLKLSTGKPTRGYKRNAAAVTAIESIYVMWFFYIVLYLLYEFAGDTHILTYIFFFLNSIWALFLLSRLSKFWNVTRAIRYAIPTALIAFASYEVMLRWNILDEIWLYPKEYILELILISAAIAIGILIAIFTPEGEKQRLFGKDNPK
jgi:hypothetical protein|tara:strand:- start:29 stop:883 length:855 start_codon:yes stop_codon:yes gene_type:complete